MGDKWNLMTVNYQFVFNEWFDGLETFKEGFAPIKIGDKWTFINTVTKTTYTDKNVKENKSYRYTIRAAYNKTYSDCNANGTLIKYVPTYKVNLSKVPKFSNKPT